MFNGHLQSFSFSFCLNFSHILEEFIVHLLFFWQKGWNVEGTSSSFLRLAAPLRGKRSFLYTKKNCPCLSVCQGYWLGPFYKLFILASCYDQKSLWTPTLQECEQIQRSWSQLLYLRGNESSYCREIVLWMKFNNEINFNTILTIIEDLWPINSNSITLANYLNNLGKINLNKDLFWYKANFSIDNY